MSNIKNEVIQKLRSDIRTKLDQIGAIVDNELADYIMVLVANQKSKYQMKDDLSLFLGKETDNFVNWLHLTLKNMQLTAIQSEDRKLMTSKKIESNKDLVQNPLIKDKNKQKVVVKSDETNGSSVSNDSETIEKSKDEKNDSLKSSKSVNAVSPQPTINSIVNKDNEIENIVSDEESVKNENEKHERDKEENNQEVILHLNPDGGEVDELLQENDFNEENKNVIKEAKVKPIRSAKVEPLRRKPISVITASSTRNTSQETEEDIYDPTRPTVGSVASVVRVTERKPSVPIELQANKMLLLRAVKDAHQSMINNNKKRTINDNEYTPTPIKKRLGERQQIVAIDEVKEDLHPEDLRNYLNVTKKDSDDKDLLDSSEMEQNLNNNRIVKQVKAQETFENPQFVVTLDGVDHQKYAENIDLTDDILLDEEMDEELVEAEDIAIEEEEDTNDMNVNKVNERCRYWPSCKNGDECEFQHPNTHCTSFPNCRFGDKCLYIHPNCKFDSMCSRKDCPFTHASKRRIPTSPAIISSLCPPSSVKPCRYSANCKNPACVYQHPGKICNYGSKCRSKTCPYVHPNPGYGPILTSIPHPNQLKWKAKDHISERQFAVSNTVHKNDNLLKPSNFKSVNSKTSQ